MKAVFACAAIAIAAIVGVVNPTTAEAAGFPTIDGRFSGTGAIGHGGVFNLTVTGRGGVPASGVDAVAINVTVTNPTASSYLTVWPTGAAQPTAANLNFVPGQTVPNMVIAKVGIGGQISIYNFNGATDVVVDVLGWFPTGGSYTGLSPARLMDSRPGSPTIDALYSETGMIGHGAVAGLTVLGRGGVPAHGVDAVAINVTVTNPTASSYLTVWPTGAAQPTAANLNFVPGQTVPNMVIAKVGIGGQISIYNFNGATDVVVDVLGWFPVGVGYTALTPARLMDSRSTTRVVQVVDGDTVDLDNGARVRLIGIDAPEVGSCEADAAAQALHSLVAGRTVTLTPGDDGEDVDRYGRLLRYVDVDGGDAGLSLIQAGLAIARYDSRDGYGRHGREDAYVAADLATAAYVCSPPSPLPPADPTPAPPPSGVYYKNCAAARAAGAAPIYFGEPGYRPQLDGDGDGIACEWA